MTRPIKACRVTEEIAEGVTYSHVLEQPDIDDFRPNNTYGSETIAPNYRKYLTDKQEKGADYANTLRALGGYRGQGNLNP